MNNLENFWKKHIKWIIPVALIFILATSIYTYFRSQKTDTLDAWASFWSGIFGTIASVVIAIWIMQRQIREESKNRRKDEESRKNDNIDNTFFNLLNLHVGNKEKLLSTHSKTIDSIFENIREEEAYTREKIAENELNNIITKNKKSILLKIEKNISDLISDLSKIDSFEHDFEFIERDYSSRDNSNRLKYNGYLIFKLFKSASSLKNYLNAQSKINPQNLFFNFSLIKSFDTEELKHKDYYYDIFKELDILQNIKYSIKDGEKIFIINSNQVKYYQKYDNIKEKLIKFLPEDVKDKKVIQDANLRVTDPLSLKQKTKLIDTELNSKHHIIGSFLRFFYRIIKYININVNDPEIKKNYFGFLRATLDENLMLLIFYNATYSTVGKKMGKELLNTNFFGDKLDFDTNNKNTPFIRYENLIFGDEDVEKMKKYFS